MKTKLFLLVFFMVSYLGLGQQTVVDSLKTLLDKKEVPDTLRTIYLLNMAHAIATTNKPKATQYTQEALKIAKSNNWNVGIAKAYRQQGNVYYLKSDFTQALQQYHRALDAAHFEGKNLFDATVYSNIANIYADMEEFDRALENYNKLLQIAEETASKPQQLIAIFNIATVQMDQGKDSLAVENLQKALSLSEEKPLQIYYPTVCNNLGLAYQHLEDYEKALVYYDKALERAEIIDDKATMAIVLTNMGKIYGYQGKTRKAETTLLKSIDLNAETGALDREAESWLALSETYQNQGKGNEALAAYKKHIVLNDSIQNREKQVELVKKDLSYEHQKEQALSQAEIDRQRTLKKTVIIGGSVLLLALVVILVLYKKKRDAVEAKTVSQFESKVDKTKLKALRSQLNPHFIFNSLNSIHDFVAKNEKTEAKAYLVKFATLMRQTLENSEKEAIPLKEDLGLLTTYFEIEQKRLQHKFSFKITVDPSIDVENTLVPPLILQPFAENSIWHGISQKTGTGHILVQVQKKEGMILYSIDDDGVGQLKDATKNGKTNKSYGMKLTKNRIAIINKRNSVQGHVRLIDKKQGVRVEVGLPLQLAF
tara:strand:+ start:17197 stop:18984 length:1788 start_codon:yes stop_codon:yes gene_type:complete